MTEDIDTVSGKETLQYFSVSVFSDTSVTQTAMTFSTKVKKLGVNITSVPTNDFRLFCGFHLWDSQVSRLFFLSFF